MKTTKGKGAELAAREKKLGLWADPNPIKPYQFRKAKNMTVKSQNSTMSRLMTKLLERCVERECNSLYSGCIWSAFGFVHAIVTLHVGGGCV